MDILCSDKTGTLTKNELSIDQSQIVVLGDFVSDDVLFDAALSARTEVLFSSSSLTYCIFILLIDILSFSLN